MVKMVEQGSTEHEKKNDYLNTCLSTDVSFFIIWVARKSVAIWTSS